MARPIKRLHGEPDVVKDLRRRSRSSTRLHQARIIRIWLHPYKSTPFRITWPQFTREKLFTISAYCRAAEMLVARL